MFCWVGLSPSPRNPEPHRSIMTSQKLPTLQECLDAPAFSAVTRSIFQIEPESSSQLYITPAVEGRKKPKDPRFACLGYIQKLKGIPSTAKNILVWLVMERQWRTDRLIIVGKGECADHFGISRRQVIRLFQILEESGCLRIFKKGGSARGSKREANTYALGSLFDNLPPEEPKRRAVTKMSLVPQVPLVPKMSDDQCQECHPLPIVPPIHTHTGELPSAFNKENWLKECQRLNPSRDLKDIGRTFPLAFRKGAKDGDWMHLVEYYDSFYTHRSNPAVRSPAPRPAVKSSCESPRQARLDYKDPKILEEVLFVALRNGDSIACIIAGLDPAYVESIKGKAQARLESPRNRSRMA